MVILMMTKKDRENEVTLIMAAEHVKPQAY